MSKKKYSLQLKINGKNPTESTTNAIVAFQFIDRLGIINDEIIVSFDYNYQIPEQTTQINPILSSNIDGKENQMDCGTFTINNVERNEQKRIINLYATGTNFNTNIKQIENKTYNNFSLKEIIEFIANKYNLNASVDIDTIYNYLCQLHESDLAFLQRLALENNAIFQIKNNTIIFKNKLSPNNFIITDPQKVDNINFIKNSNYNYNSARITYFDNRNNRIENIDIGTSPPTLKIYKQFYNRNFAFNYLNATFKRIIANRITGYIVDDGFNAYAEQFVRITTGDFAGDYEIYQALHIFKNFNWKTKIYFRLPTNL